MAIREFALQKPHGRADYLPFVDRLPVGALEAKPEGTTLTEVELQSSRYSDGLPEGMSPPPLGGRNAEPQTMPTDENSGCVCMNSTRRAA